MDNEREEYFDRDEEYDPCYEYYDEPLTTKFKGTYEGMEITASINWTAHTESNYGADADGNRGVSRTEYEPESLYDISVNGSEDFFDNLRDEVQERIERFIYLTAEYEG